MDAPREGDVAGVDVVGRQVTAEGALEGDGVGEALGEAEVGDDDLALVAVIRATLDD